MVKPLPLIALDVDGVLAPDGGLHEERAAWPLDSYRRATSPGSFNLPAPEEVLAFLREIHETGLARIVWLTAWRWNAADHLAPDWNLPEFEVLSAHETEEFGWWKAAAIAPFMDGVRPVIWIDDDLDYSREAGDVPSAWDAQTTYICPDLRAGLTPAHLELIRTLLAPQEA